MSYIVEKDSSIVIEDVLSSVIYNSEEIREKYFKDLVNVILGNFDGVVEKIYLFGSYARGEQTKESDTDVFVVFSKYNGKESKSNIYYLDQCDLDQKYNTLTHIMYTDDKDFKISDCGLYNSIKKEGVILYEK